jgi:hypothetical protein
LAVRAAPFALLCQSRKTECGAGNFLAHLAVRAAPFALLKKWLPTKARVNPFFLHRTGGTRLCGLASVGRDLSLVLLELGLRLPFVDLGHRDNTSEDGADRLADVVC